MTEKKTLCHCGKELMLTGATVLWRDVDTVDYGPEPRGHTLARCMTGHLYYHWMDSGYHVVAPYEKKA